MRRPEIPLLPYDSTERELGFATWFNLQNFMYETDESTNVRRRVRQTLVKTHARATERFSDPSEIEYDYERPFLYVTSTGKAFDGGFPESDSTDVTIALDILHGFVAIQAFKQEFSRRDISKQQVYYAGVNPSTRDAITRFVNSHVEAQHACEA